MVSASPTRQTRPADSLNDHHETFSTPSRRQTSERLSSRARRRLLDAINAFIGSAGHARGTRGASRDQRAGGRRRRAEMRPPTAAPTHGGRHFFPFLPAAHTASPQSS